MDILECLGREEIWRAYLADCEAQAWASRREIDELRAFIEGGSWRALAARMADPSFCFAPPEKKMVNKSGSGKKRAVYAFSPDESRMLKLAARLLHRYDALLPDSCCAFRRGATARGAVLRLARRCAREGMWCMKMDVTNYFNSIDPARLLPVLKRALSGDPALYALMARMLEADECVFGGSVIREKRGGMAGMPISPFLANLYLADMDRAFEEAGVPYARYSDDIIFFAPNREALDALGRMAKAMLAEHALSVNEKKTRLWAPGEGWEFLGVKVSGAQIDLSRATSDKLKAKLRRKSKALRRWMARKGASPQQAMRAYARAVNRKLFENPRADELTWTRWFFPMLTRGDSLREIDLYNQQCMRFVATGRHSKANYRISYSALKDCGLRSLLHEYYARKSRWDE